MIDMDDVTRDNRTILELQEFLLLSILVAGKKATVQAKKLDDFLFILPSNSIDLFDAIKFLVDNNLLLSYIQQVKFGQYRRLSRCFTELVNANLDLYSCTVEDLENISGIGPKTARFFLLHSRENYKCAVLDVHILKFMKEYLYIDTPLSTPSGKKYSELEKKFLEFCDKINKDIAYVDLQIWKAYSNKKPELLKEFIGE